MECIRTTNEKQEGLKKILTQELVKKAYQQKVWIDKSGIY
jgi:hypothetical protein